MERELLLTGIGGQGVQLAAQLVANAAIADRREVMMFGSYGGMMRGGNTDATIVIADEPIKAPPTVPTAWGAVVMHHQFWATTKSSLREGSVAFINSTVFVGDLDLDGVQVIRVAATDLAVDVGNIMTASVVMIGALSAATRLISFDALVEAIPRCLPPYRKQHIAINELALRVGYDSIANEEFLAWSTPDPAYDTVGR
jgi:2-oxoglutarate ferredoxin oxidoreductase subunit gamma